MATVLPGDVLVTRDPTWWARLIRVGAAMRDQPDSWNHVIIASHTDAAGVQWGIEGRPGGVGWVDLRLRLADRWTIDNAEQPKTDDQRAQVVSVAKGMLGTPYDWSSIVKDAMIAIDAGWLWRMRAFGTAPPAHVVCSSLAAWIYDHVSLKRPTAGGPARTTTPADWASFILRRDWA